MRLPVSLVALSLLSTACDDSTATPKSGGAEKDPNVIEIVASKPVSRPALDEKEAKRYAQTVASVTEVQRSMVASLALFELEGERIPSSASKLLEELAGVPPDMAGLTIAKALSEPELLGELDALCSGKARETMRNLAMTAPPDKSSGLWTACGLERVGLMTAEEAAAAAQPMAMLLAHVIAWHLKEGGGASDEELELLRALAAMPAV